MLITTNTKWRAVNLNEDHAILEKQIPRRTNYHTDLTITKSVERKKDMWRFFLQIGRFISWLTNEAITYQDGDIFMRNPWKSSICIISVQTQAKNNKISSAHFLALSVI